MTARPLESMHNELKLRYREFFESKLAVEMLKEGLHFASVQKISLNIAKLLLTHESTVKKIIDTNAAVIANLKEPFFGSIFDSKEEVFPEQVFNKIVKTLFDNDADLKHVMQIHSVFIHYIYDQLEKPSGKAELVKQLFPNSLFNTESRRRIEKIAPKPTMQMGITDHPVFMKQVGSVSNTHNTHIRAVDRFQINTQCAFFKSTAEKNIPIVCGPSGHTGSFMLGAKLYGDLSLAELKEYAFAAFAFLAAGGNHSFHEVMMVAQLAGVDFQENNYVGSIPSSVQETSGYKSLSKLFPEFLTSQSKPTFKK